MSSHKCNKDAKIYVKEMNYKPLNASNAKHLTAK